MTIEQMKESLKTVRLLEKDLMRDLTNEEKDIVVNKGWEEFLFEYLNMSKEDYVELRALKNIISAFYTQDESELDNAIINAPFEVYYVLKDIMDKMEKFDHVTREDPVEDFATFLQELYDSLPKKESGWFNRLTDNIRKHLFEVYTENKGNEGYGTDALCGTLTDTLKDDVIKDMVEKLKNGETLEMTEDEFLEVTDYLCKHEDKVFIHNNNGHVKLMK